MMQAVRDVHVPGVGACAKGALLADDEPLVARARAGSFVAVPEDKPKRSRKAPVEVEADESADDGGDD